MTLEGPSSREIRSKHGSDRENEIYIGIVDNLPYISWDKYNIRIYIIIYMYVYNIYAIE